MFGKQESRRHKAERIAGQAWDNLSAAVDSSTKSAGKKAVGMFDDTSSRVGSGAKEARKRAGSGAKEARKRANEAFDALAGRRRPTRWGWLAAATLVGAAIGWVVTTVSQKFMPRHDALELPESLVDDNLDTASTKP